MSGTETKRRRKFRPGEEREHTHDDTCWETQEVLVCGKPTAETAHRHTKSCYDGQERVICGEKEIPTFTCSDRNWVQEVVAEGHRHTEACYGQQPVCGIPEHVHTAECYPAVTTEELAEEEPTEGPECSGRKPGRKWNRAR